jgi:hypothetical protein
LLSVEERRQRQALGGRIGGYRLAASHDPKEYTAAGRTAFERRFVEGIPDDLPPEEVARRVAAAKKAYYSELALKSARTRSAKAAASP